MLKPAGNRGFTIIEAMVGLALMLAGLAGAGVVLLQSVQYERETSHRRSAIRLAGSLAEELRALDRDDGTRLTPDSEPILAWTALVAAAMPQGSEARVDIGEATPATYTISIAWPVAGIGTQRITLQVAT
jgi:type II secretory pathway pseudopilin PulG